MVAERVSIGFIHPGEVAGSFAASLAATVLNDRSNRIRHIFEFQSSPRVAEGRTQLVRQFLDKTHDDWLLMIDADMAWEPQAFERLCFKAQRKRVPVIGALCFGGGRSIDAAGIPVCFPTLYKFVQPPDEPLGIEKLDDYPDDALIPVGATGAAFLMVHRDVYNTLAEKLSRSPDGYPNPYPWFAETVNRGRAVGEDITFCMRAQACGFQIHVDTGAKVRHRKSIDLTETLWRTQEVT